MNEIIVGNVGSVYRGSDDAVAEEKFNTYVESSKSNCGRAGVEAVVWFQNDEIFKEYEGTLNHE